MIAARLNPASLPDARGHFGRFGGRFVPGTLMSPLTELEQAYRAARRDTGFRRRLRELLTSYAGRPTPLYLAERLTRHAGGARLYLKREDLCHSGAHKINKRGQSNSQPNRLEATFIGLRQRGARALIPYFTAGDPSLSVTRQLVIEAAKRGADIIELGIPFSDPRADGPVIQRATHRALAAGVTLPRVIELVRELRGDVAARWSFSPTTIPSWLSASRISVARRWTPAWMA